jgi:hypothetical protein
MRRLKMSANNDYPRLAKRQVHLHLENYRFLSNDSTRTFITVSLPLLTFRM